LLHPGRGSVPAVIPLLVRHHGVVTTSPRVPKEVGPSAVAHGGKRVVVDYLLATAAGVVVGRPITHMALGVGRGLRLIIPTTTPPVRGIPATVGVVVVVGGVAHRWRLRCPIGKVLSVVLAGWAALGSSRRGSRSRCRILRASRGRVGGFDFVFNLVPERLFRRL